MTNRRDKPKADLLISGASEVVTCAPRGRDPLGRIAQGSLAIAGQRIIAVGTAEEVASQVETASARIIDARSKVVAPGFVDCHTHLVFGGSRTEEYAARLTRGPAEVEALGILTGIPATVAQTRAASLEELVEDSGRRLGRMLKTGSTTVESKSGYGLSAAEELKQLEVNRRLASSQPADVVSTFLGAHDFPKEMSRKRYIELIIKEMIPQVAAKGLAEFCDVYCDEGYYTVAESRAILEAGQAAGLKAKIHADAYSASGGADLAAEIGAVSADHLNYASPDQMSRLAQAGVVGVVMPALDFAVAHPRPFEARTMLDQGLTLALATDLCPSCWAESMRLVMVLACRLHRMSAGEAMMAATLGAAQALSRQAEVGSLEPGKLADVQIWSLPTLEDVVYSFDYNPVVSLIKRGRVLFEIEE